MATKLNRKFVLVVTGFAVAAAALLVGVIVVYQVYVKDAERNIVKGDQLMAEGKLREAFATYGRAVSKKPGELRYVEKMEEALSKIVATTGTAASEDYGSLLGVKRARTRARPTDPEQWRQLLLMLEERASLYSRGEGWADVIDVAKDMKSSVPADAPGAELADVFGAFGRSQRVQTLSARERADLVKQLRDIAAKHPAEWRVWKALEVVLLADVQQAASAGQVDEAAARMKSLDETLAAADAALAGAGPEAAAVNEQLKFQRLLADVRTGRLLNPKLLDPVRLRALSDSMMRTALASGSSAAVREAAALLAAAGEPRDSLKLMDEWVAAHPSDLRTRATAIALRAQLAQYQPEEMEALRTAAKAFLEQPQQPTSLNASMQDAFKTTVIGALLNVELARIADEKDAAARAPVMAEVARLRDLLKAAVQNDENNPAIIAADAKIAQVNGDIPGAQRKWETYFSKAPQPSQDVYLWAALAARARGDFSLALQYVTKGMEANPDDLGLALQRADLAGRLGRRGEELAMLSDLAKALPDNAMIQAALKNAQERADTGGAPSGGAGKALLDIEEAVKAGQCDRARALAAAFAKDTPQGVAGAFVQARVELSCGDAAKAGEYVEAGLAKEPNSLDLWRIKAEMMSNDPIERIEILVKGVIPDPRRQAAELLSALRNLRVDLMRREQALRGPDPQGADKVKAQLDTLATKIAAAEQVAGATAADDQGVIESNFAQAVEDYQTAMAAGRQQDAQAAFARASAQLEASRKLTGSPEVPVVFESTLLELQGKIPEALAVVERARARGQNEARLAMRLAALQERLGNEPAALRAWQEAYERRANDPNVVIGYCRAMGRAGKGREMLDVLRAAADANPMDTRLALLLAQFETTYGSRARAIAVRQDLARRMQPIPENVAGLYSLLHMAPSTDAVKGPDGRPMTGAQWTSLSNEQRARYLSDTARDFQAQAEALYAEAMRANPLDIALAVQKARVMREQARFDEGTRAIQAVIDAAKARGPVPAGMYLDLGVHLLQSGKQEEADRAFDMARAAQDPQKREADLVLVEIEARRGRVKAAAEALANHLQTNPRLELQARLCELLLAAGEVDKVPQAIDRVRSMAGSDPNPGIKAMIEMLDGALNTARADRAERSGKLEEAKKFRDAALAAMGRAEVLQPASYLPGLRRVMVMRDQAKSGGRLDQAMIDLAAAEADKLLARNAAAYDIAAQRASIEIDKGDLQGAIGVLDRFLVAQPQDDTARARLIALYREVGNRQKAVELARNAADGAPFRADWRELLGDLSADAGDHAGAAAAYERAFQIQPQVYKLVAKAVDERVAAGAPQQGLAFLASVSPEAQAFPMVRAAQAVALAKLNRQAEALAVAKEAIQGARAAGINSVDMQEVLPRLRRMFGADRTQELEDLMVSTGTPNASEKVLLGNMWTDPGSIAPDKAIQWADSALAEGEAIPAGLRAMAHTLRGNGLFLKEFFLAADLEPDSPGALNNAAYISAEAGGDLERSLDFAERAVGLVPERAEFVDTLGYVLLLRAQKAGDTAGLQRAEEVLKRSLQLRPSAAAHVHLGMAQAALGRSADARKSLDKARQDPGLTPELQKKIDEASKALQ
jgi:lipopolysaccharide biosynthesis regulator YciM